MIRANRSSRVWTALQLLFLLGLLCGLSASAFAQAEPGWKAADAVQKALHHAQIALLSHDQPSASIALDEALAAFTERLRPQAQAAESREALAAAEQALLQAQQAVERNDQPAFTFATGRVQAALFQIGSAQTLASLATGDVDAASEWLLLRAFRHVSRFERLSSDATRTLLDLRAGSVSAEQAYAIVQTDLLDTYQARLNAALHDLALSDSRELAAGRAQQVGLASGYFAILAPTYREQRGEQALAQAQAAFNALEEAAGAGKPIAELLPAVETALRGFRAAPLSAAEQNRRAGQLLRFIGLVSVEYARGVKGEQVTIPLEIQEASTFRDGAAAAFADLRSLLDERDPERTQQIADLFGSLEQQLLAAKNQSAVLPAATIQASTEQITALLQAVMPPEWKQQDSSADFDVIAAALDQMERALAAGQFEQAESARLEAYAILESGPEAKLQAFAPQLTPQIEALFWYGTGSQPGLASLIGQKASAEQVSALRNELDVQLAEAQQALAGNSAPVSVAANAALIVFREGLEAVLILASLLGSLKIGAQRALRKPLWLGAVLALCCTAATWLLARELLQTLARYGERLEAVVSLIAIGVLLLITNWFFHNVYWTGWMANFHRQKKRIIGGAAGQIIGLIMLGFTSIYREGFETVLFLQALVLDAGTATVLTGVLIGISLTVLIGVLVFVVQAKLPHKKMLIFTGILIGAVLLQMVGNTVHVLQIVGWMPIHPIRWLSNLLPYWSGMWFGLYATWEGLICQFAAAVFTIGSYFVAEHGQKRATIIAREQPASSMR